MLAGLLLVFPGFVSDVAAVLLLLPPTRALARRPLERALARAAANRASFPTTMCGYRGEAVVTGEVIDEPRRRDDDPPSPIYGTPH